MLTRLSAFVIWALVAATVVFWGLRLIVRAPAAPAYVVPVGDASAVRGDLSRVLGAAPAATSAAMPQADVNSRFRLLGIMAPKSSSTAVATHGVALIAVDGKMPKAYTVGAPLDGDLVLQSVSLRTASIGIGNGAPALTLELPPLPAAATGKLPAGGTSGGTPVPAMAAPPPPIQPPLVPQPMQAPPMPVPPSSVPVRPDAGALPAPGQTQTQ